jgi:hypothetical protein
VPTLQIDGNGNVSLRPEQPFSPDWTALYHVIKIIKYFKINTKD